jgi:hypothetical protein
MWKKDLYVIIIKNLEVWEIILIYLDRLYLITRVLKYGEPHQLWSEAEENVIMEEGKSDTISLGLKMEEGGQSQSVLVTSRWWKKAKDHILT